MKYTKEIMIQLSREEKIRLLLEYGKWCNSRNHVPLKKEIENKFHIGLYNYFENTADYYKKAQIPIPLKYHTKAKIRSFLINFAKQQVKIHRFPSRNAIQKKFNINLLAHFKNTKELYDCANISYNSDKLAVIHVKIEEQEGSVVHMKALLKTSDITVGDLVLIKARNLLSNTAITFPANVRSSHRINIRKSIRSRLGLTSDIKTPVRFEIVKKLDRIRLQNRALTKLSNNLVQVLPNNIKVKNRVTHLNCYNWMKNKVILSYQTSKNSNPIIMNKKFVIDPFIVGLWRAEGGKYRLVGSALQFTNSNPKVVCKWMSFINSLGFSSNDSRIRYYIQYIAPRRDVGREKVLLEHWTNLLKLPSNKFGWIYKKGPGYKSKYAVYRSNSITPHYLYFFSICFCNLKSLSYLDNVNLMTQ